MPDQKPNEKNEEIKKPWLQYVRETVGDWLQPMLDLAQNWEKMRDITKNNFDLGVRHLKLGNISDAILRFKLVVWLDSLHTDAWYYLGCAYIADGKSRLAQNAFARALELEPDYEEARYMLAIARGPDTPADELPSRIPATLAETHFDALAPDFTEDQLERDYQGHMQLTQVTRAVLEPGRLDHMILELGVGSGLCGPLMRDIASQIIGIDMSGEMLAEAMQLRDADGKKIYDALLHREAHEFLQQSPMDTYDIVMAAGMMNYIGDLGVLFEETARVLKSDGIFAFTADSMVDPLEVDEFRFDPAAGSFLYAASYLRQLAADNNLNEVRFEEVTPYPNITAWLCVFKKS